VGTVAVAVASGVVLLPTWKTSHLPQQKNLQQEIPRSAAALARLTSCSRSGFLSQWALASAYQNASSRGNRHCHVLARDLGTGTASPLHSSRVSSTGRCPRGRIEAVGSRNHDKSLPMAQAGSWTLSGSLLVALASSGAVTLDDEATVPDYVM
jgi:hypothetical protein